MYTGVLRPGSKIGVPQVSFCTVNAARSWLENSVEEEEYFMCFRFGRVGPPLDFFARIRCCPPAIKKLLQVAMRMEDFTGPEHSLLAFLVFLGSPHLSIVLTESRSLDS
jgi:hypothetical protein